VVQTVVIENAHKDVAVTSCMLPPSMEEMLGYEGIILDERLPGESGLAIARRIQRLNWRIPIMIMTMMRPSDETFDTAYEAVDYVATKSDPAMFINVMHAFVRQIKRIRAASLADEAK
jgi:DNA-binding response OmpR family regulator